MKKHINILLAISVLLISNMAFAEDEISFFNSVVSNDGEGVEVPATSDGDENFSDGDEYPGDQAPIDDYIPYLLVGGLILGLSYRKNRVIIK